MKINKIIDLSGEIMHGNVVWPGAPLPEFQRLGIAPKDGYNIELLKMTPHVSTHMDSPYHMIQDGKTIDELSVESFLGEGTVVDVSYKKPGEYITPNDVRKHETNIKSGDIVFFNTGWGDKVNFTREFLYEFPGLNTEAAEWLASKPIKGVGIDTLGIEPYPETKFPVHHILLGKGIWQIEGLRNLGKLLSKPRWFFVALPLRLKGCSASWCRVIALDAE